MFSVHLSFPCIIQALLFVTCSVPIVPPSVSTTAAVQSPFLQLQQQQQQQQQQLQHRQRQQQLQFLANALQLQSQLNAHVQNRPGTAPATGMCSR